TSRQALGLTGEIVRRVAPLSLPEEPWSRVDGQGSMTDEFSRPHRPSTIDHAPSAWLQSEAAQLFRARAQAVPLHVTVTTGRPAPVGQVCRRLDGIPLAIELAAARLSALSIEQIATRLDDRFRLLTGGSRTALPRQQTLRATLDWSYDLLPEPERVLLQ